MKRTPPTLEQHAELGRRLYAAYRAALDASCFASGVYGKTSPECRQAHKAYLALLALRSMLDDRACRENPHGTEVLKAYYPGADKESAT